MCYSKWIAASKDAGAVIMRKPVTKGRIIESIICTIVFIMGIVVIALTVNADSAFPVIGGILLCSLGGAVLLSIWFPLDGGSHSNQAKPTSSEKADKKEARDIAIAAMLVADELLEKKEVESKGNVWADNSEDNDDADPDNW